MNTDRQDEQDKERAMLAAFILLILSILLNPFTAEARPTESY
jgi:hypothetical protein